MDPASSAAISAVAQVGKCLWIPFKQQAGFLIHFRKNVENSKTRVQELMWKRNDIRTLVERRCSSGEVVTEQVQGWITRADAIEAEWNNIEQEIEENKRVLVGWFSNWGLRYKLGKQAKEKLNIVVEHLSKANFGENVTMPAPLSRVELQPTPSIEGLPSVRSSMQQVMDSLQDKKIRTIGVYGMGGVGKTTLVKNVNNQLEKKSLFDKVVMVTVSKDVDYRRLQGEISQRLGLNLEDGSEVSRANVRRRSMMQAKENKFLIILDDLWERVELDSIGIPWSGHQACKFIITSRSEHVCRQMESNVVIKVNVLSGEDSWKLFKEKAGDVVDYPNLHPVVRDVAKECDGLPLAIVTLGRALRNEKKRTVWENALSQLKKSAPTDIEGMEQVVYQSIRFSYDYLQNDELKMCFLFCCLFPEDYDIEEERVIRHWMFEGLLQDVENWEEAMNKGHAFVEKLKACCLILEGEEMWCTRMHDIVRDVAIYIASKDEHQFLVRAGLGLNGWPIVDGRKRCKVISVMKNDIKQLPERMECPELQTLIMQQNLNLIKIPDSFFIGTEGLSVLDLSDTAIRRLPQSMSKLVNLLSLCLRKCEWLEIDGMSPLGRLKKLELLDLSETCFHNLPIEIGELINLRCLDLSRTLFLHGGPRNVISKLTRLEELKLMGSYLEWGVNGDGVGRNVSFAELASLTRLTCLSLSVADVNRYTQNVLFEPLACLKRFNLFLRSSFRNNKDELLWGKMRHFPRTLVIEGSKPIVGWVEKLLLQTMYLSLESREGVRTIFELVDKESNGFQGLEYLRIERCGIECVVGGKESRLPNLQSIELFDLDELVNFISDNGTLLPGSLQNLRYCKLFHCHRLTHHHLFPPSVLQRMDNLIELHVNDCKELKHVFIGGEVDRAVLPKLERLEIEHLPKMKSIWLRVVPHGSLQNLHELKIHECHSLKNVLSSSALAKGCLPNLAALHVTNCSEVDEIISIDEEEVDIKDVLSKLTTLELRTLPKLKHLFSGREALDLHSLQNMNAYACYSMRKPPFGAHSAPSLQIILGKEWWDQLEWEDDSVKARFQPLVQ